LAVSRGLTLAAKIKGTHKLVRDGGSQAKRLGDLNSRVNAFSDASEEDAGVVDVGEI
jgi:methylmalonyl-CoA mutase cobalamin-binding subunit